MQQMMETSGNQTLEGALADRFGDLVYAAARRQMDDAHAAAGVTQVVFMVMSRKERQGKLPEERFMAGWLLQVTRYAVKEAKRAARRRRRHERLAAVERPETPLDEGERGAMLDALDEALLALRAMDRELIARRYLRSESVRDVAASLGTTENTASKRIERALGKLRELLVRRGVTMDASGIVGGMAGEALVKMPAVMTVKSGGIAASVTGHGVRKVLRRMTMAKMKIVAAVVGAGVVCGGGATVYVRSLRGAEKAVAATAPVDFGPTTLNSQVRHFGEFPAGKPRPVTESTELEKRYSWIFSQLDEKRDADAQIDELAKSARAASADKRSISRHILAMQATLTATLWNHMEAAVKVVAQQHGESVAELNNAPALPADPVEAGTNAVQWAIRDRTVIPLNDDMAREVLALANARYAKEKAAGSRPY